MPISNGLRTALNNIRETSIENNTLYHRYVPEILPTTDIGSFASPLLENPDLMNEFLNVLVKRIAYTKIENKIFRNKLRVLEGDNIPLGAIGQEIYINPAKGRQFNVNDFAGLLAKYESDVKVEYHQLNSDLQYPATITRPKLKDAFVSWSSLEDFVNGITQSLYNGAYIDQYNLTKGLVACAYASNQVVSEVISNPTTSEANANTFLTKAREIYLNMQEPTPDYNAWRKVGGYGKDILTWTDPENIVLLIRNDIGAYLDVNTLANAFNIDKKVLLGNVIYVNNFNQYDSEGELVYDGSNIIGMIADKSWFKIKEQEMTMDEFYNANNRTWNLYLNVVKLYSYSLFSNAVVFALAEPSVPATAIEFVETDPTVVAGEKITLEVKTTPFSANPTITFTSGTVAKATVTKVDDKHVEVTGVAEGTSVITATDGTNTATVTVTVKASE